MLTTTHNTQIELFDHMNELDKAGWEYYTNGMTIYYFYA